MTANDINREVLDTYKGRIMRKLDASAFKIVVCLGADRSGRKLRVCVWSDNQRKWSNPQSRRVDQLDAIAQLDDLKDRHRLTVVHAWQHIEAHANDVAFSGARVRVGKPWLNKGAAPKPQPAGVTKLAAEGFTVTPEGRTKLKKLNQLMTKALFGGGS